MSALEDQYRAVNLLSDLRQAMRLGSLWRECPIAKGTSGDDDAAARQQLSSELLKVNRKIETELDWVNNFLGKNSSRIEKEWTRQILESPFSNEFKKDLNERIALKGGICAFVLDSVLESRNSLAEDGKRIFIAMQGSASGTATATPELNTCAKLGIATGLTLLIPPVAFTLFCIAGAAGCF